MYHALYRKYRPDDFDSVVGQDSIVRTLKNSIKNDNFSHAYMFFGPRGTGKTTLSKIFARNVNCLNHKDGVACRKCDACKVSFSRECVDIIEIDAASNNGVNEIRELRNNVALVPSELKYKVYIVDEVHMLSDAAFNALLKTLEEPPEHVIFILATTDPQKVPDTIISRCQCFSFKRIADEVIKNKLRSVCDIEKIKIDDAVLNKIALLSDGGLRDALGSLDKMVSYTDKQITLEDFYEVNGIVSDSEINSFLNYIFVGNIKDVLNCINDYNSKGKNLIQIIIQTIDFARNLLVDYYLTNKELEFPLDLLQLFINLLNEKINDIKKSSNTKVYIEMFLLKFINDYIISNNDNHSSIESKSVEKSISTTNKNLSIKKSNLNNNDLSASKDESVNNNESIVDVSTSKSDDTIVITKNDNSYEDFNDTVNSTVPKVLNIDDIISIRINNALATADKELLNKEKDNFELLKDYSFDQEIGYLVNSILDSNLRVVGKENIIISYDSDANVEQNLINIISLNDVYNKITKSNKSIAIISDNDWNKLKKEYIDNLKNNIKYEIKEEPEPILEEIKNDDIITSGAISLFGEDIVEIE